MIYTTLNRIRTHGPCSNGWASLLRHLGKTRADDEPLAIGTILDSNGFDDALWCLRAVDGHQREIRLYAVWCARQVQHLMTDPRSLAALDVAERHANGDATDKKLAAAWAAAWAAVDVAERHANGDATDKKLAAAWDAAWAAARAAQTAALSDVARAAQTAASRYAAGAAWAVARAASMAASSDVARAAQAAEFRRVFCGEEVTA